MRKDGVWNGVLRTSQRMVVGAGIPRGRVLVFERGVPVLDWRVVWILRRWRV